jgi:hypothetical protein
MITIIANQETTGRIPREAHFELCSYCFWCASSLNGKLSEICPLCKSSSIDSIPIITGKETLVDNYATKHRISKDFSHQDFLVAG